jgi:hypothetical protein
MRRDVENTQKRILDSLRENGPQTTSQMVESTGLSRDTINEYCKKFAKYNTVKKSGKFGKYSFTGDGNIHGYPSLKGKNFGTKATRRIFSDPVFTTNNDPKSQLKKLVEMLAALHLYVLIQAMAPKVWDPMFDGIPIEGKTGAVRDKAAGQWLANSIDPFQILNEFSKLKVVSRGLHIGTAVYPPSLRNFIEHYCHRPKDLSSEQKKEWQQNAINACQKYNESYKKNAKMNFKPHDRFQSNFELDDETYDDLINVFEELYPELYHDFQQIWKGLDNEVKADLFFLSNYGKNKFK